MKKKPIVTVFIVALVLALAYVAVFLYERSKVALIVDDEAAWDLRDASPQKKVIVTKDGMIARYVSEDDTSYVGDIQDTFVIPKEDATVETWYACDGKGFVSLNVEGISPAYSAPDSLSDVVGKLQFESGYCPETYSCKGYKDGWFSIEIDGRIGYIREEYVCWDAIDTY